MYALNGNVVYPVWVMAILITLDDTHMGPNP